MSAPEYEPSTLCKQIKPPFHPVTDCEVKTLEDTVRVNAGQDLAPKGDFPAAVAIGLTRTGGYGSRAAPINQLRIVLSQYGGEQFPPIPLQVCAWMEIPPKEITVHLPTGETRSISTPGYQEQCIELGPEEIARIKVLQDKDPKWRPTRHVAAESLRLPSS